MATVTVVMVPRERFSFSPRTLSSLLGTPAGVAFDLVVVDGRSPRRIARALRKASERHGFRLLRSERYLTPNQARNLGLAAARSDYVAFVDNDVLFEPGWLAALVDCAEETGADLVGPLCCIGQPQARVVHVAGGDAHVEEQGGVRRLVSRHLLPGARVEDIHPPLERRACELIELHTLLARRSLFDRLGPLDEGLLSTREHVDLCLATRETGGAIYFEPRSVITYVPPKLVLPDELPYYLLRWSDEWARRSVARFEEKWRLTADGERRLADWIRPHRRAMWTSIERRVRPRFLATPLTRVVARACEEVLTPWAKRHAATSSQADEAPARHLV